MAMTNWDDKEKKKKEKKKKKKKKKKKIENHIGEGWQLPPCHPLAPPLATTTAYNAFYASKLQDYVEEGLFIQNIPKP